MKKPYGLVMDGDDIYRHDYYTFMSVVPSLSTFIIHTLLNFT